MFLDDEKSLKLAGTLGGFQVFGYDMTARCYTMSPQNHEK